MTTDTTSPIYAQAPRQRRATHAALLETRERVGDLVNRLTPDGEWRPVLIPLGDPAIDIEREFRQVRVFTGKIEWGPWRYRPAVRVLETKAGGYAYWIPLDTCTTSARVLAWIGQITMKTWASTEVVGGLVQALYALLPLQHLCHSDREFDARGYLKDQHQRAHRLARKVHHQETPNA